MIHSFNHDEKKALIAILKFIASSDGKISQGEIAKFNEIAEKQNFSDFSQIFDEVDAEVHTIDDLIRLADRVRLKTHEYDILKYAFEMATAGTTINPEDVEIITMLGNRWKIDIKNLLKEQ
jgi:uncharacterized tellurite resistance protein B-like protein